ncbi:Bifunctional protein RfaE domain II-containing protein [Desulfonema limicola]|uniref:D-glycero-beta-D-manno-heptose 1-phosphate adenylyltransferase n=1 Tax=Desulfonema limicola TaxID=45656 RepID=A0A975B7P8_9BACT|nr:D-glycero-beta-D-manno-heptose 1-phosphate adenylyltransferase [Desulfonema limicola]QTA80392.1 Bifunctional protein RfaE domain II-containing protein [Desulfonema limicola]
MTETISKIITDWNILVSIVKKNKLSGNNIVFTNGCFDLIHPGHVRYLTAAKAQGDILILGLNTDASIRVIKGKKRPIMNQEQRAEVLSGFECIDYITFFNETDPLRLIKSLKPDVLVKGADWEEKNIIGAEFVRSIGGRVERIAIVPGTSTSAIIDRIIKLYS